MFAFKNLTGAFSIIKKEFYGYEDGKWKRCNTQSTADKITNKKESPSHLHSPVCVCLLLQKDPSS